MTSWATFQINHSHSGKIFVSQHSKGNKSLFPNTIEARVCLNGVVGERQKASMAGWPLTQASHLAVKPCRELTSWAVTTRACHHKGSQHALDTPQSVSGEEEAESRDTRKPAPGRMENLNPATLGWRAPVAPINPPCTGLISSQEHNAGKSLLLPVYLSGGR